ncbi:hypothetical protein ACA910_020346 [Epithemia clementina (nom. ined.)]
MNHSHHSPPDGGSSSASSSTSENSAGAGQRSASDHREGGGEQAAGGGGGGGGAAAMMAPNFAARVDDGPEEEPELSESATSVAPGCSLRETRMERRSAAAAAPNPHWYAAQSYHSSSSVASSGGLAVFTWGRGEDGQLGLGDASDQEEPTYVDALRGVGVRQIACGSGHTVVLTAEHEGAGGTMGGGGQVYTWGRGDDGRLGHGENMWKYVPRSITSLQGLNMVQVTCGSYHTAAVTAQGDLYTWGGGMYGKLGHGTEAGASTPKRVQALVGLPVAQIACGSRHTAVVTATGVLYTWGDRENGVAGHGETQGHQYAPRRLERLAHKVIAQLSACGFHTAAVTDTGEVYTWGEGKFGRLGHGSERNGHVPQLVEALYGKKPRQVSCGGFHTAVVTEEGRLYTFGGGEHGQLGHNDRVNQLQPTLVQALANVFVTQITCGWSHSVALTAKGRVYTWGNGDHGKLGHGSGRKVAVPQMVEKLKDYRVVRVASYNEHTAALVEPMDLLLHHHPDHAALYAHGKTAADTVVPVTLSYRQQMKTMVNEEEYSDVTFLIENEPIYAHRAILAQRCEPFGAMFRSGMRESVERVIPIPNVRRAVFLLLLEYLYTDTVVNIDADVCVELYICADLYDLERLRDLCWAAVRRHLTADNAGMLLQTAADLHCHVLKDWIMTFCVEQFDKVSKTTGIQQVSHALLLEILSRR